jgi:hypothetical protein
MCACVLFVYMSDCPAASAVGRAALGSGELPAWLLVVGRGHRACARTIRCSPGTGATPCLGLHKATSSIRHSCTRGQHVVYGSQQGMGCMLLQKQSCA